MEASLGPQARQSLVLPKCVPAKISLVGRRSAEPVWRAAKHSYIERAGGQAAERSPLRARKCWVSLTPSCSGPWVCDRAFDRSSELFGDQWLGDVVEKSHFSTPFD